ncbi:OLC1v1019808C1 [Oldenlandia corymbosa var. corymbosa]|uniref:OLC1v1019808C1 n=1 Tax=Oldenlandia corymbosa var. corymbosa TaxID=529605 RepID=A0AAV1EFB5_OLDCO|nr:OLC1v1019808C1 [Oldenlandia corymbosa var. corymbosa]
MATIAIDEAGVARSLEGVSGGQQRCHSGEALAEWRSCEQVENGTPSTSPPYWDSDDEDGGPKPSELYGKYTWKIDKFSQINKRELRSNAFEVGGYKWYILIYPQGCDVCNHLSLFLCVANHDKLLPGWSHFAQFTIAVVNKDPKKSKYSDTLHRFWKKEHDWGWKKFMELSKVLDGFIDADTLIIKAQVQVIRERADRPFRCLDCQYRRELVRVYLTNVEQICRRFVEERRSKLGKLIEDKARWSSFCAFWMGMEQSSRRRMSREKTDSILKVIVKHFFIEKEVTSTLVMDSLYSGLKALEGQTKGKKSKGKTADSEELPVPIVRMEKDTFVLVDDVLLLLERAALEPLPPKDDKGPQNRTKDGCSGDDFNKDSIERDERRLTELGRRTIEIFVLAHIFSSKIEVAYQEAVALKRQEELIREEEAAWMAETEHKAKRGADKEKKSKKTKGKQKRNNRKAKDKVKDEKSNVTLQDKAEQDSLADVMKDYTMEEEDGILEKLENAVEDVSDVSDSVDCAPEALQPDSEDRDTSVVNWDTDTSEVHVPTEASSSEVSGLSSVQNGAGGRRSTSLMDDSSSTCSSDSVPSVINGSYKGNSASNKNQKSATRRIEQSRANCDVSDWSEETSSQPLEVASDWLASGTTDRSNVTVDLLDQTKRLKQQQLKKEKQQLKKDEEASPSKKLGAKDETEVEQLPSEKRSVVQSPPRSPVKNISSTADVSANARINAAGSPVKKQQSESLKQTNGSAQSPNSAEVLATSKPSGYTRIAPSASENLPSQQVHSGTENSSTPQSPMMSRPLSAPIFPGPRPAPPVVSLVQTPPLLSRSVSAAGRLGPEPSTASHNYVPQSYRNVMMGNHVTGGSVGFTQPHSPSSGVNTSHSYAQSAALLAKPFFLQHSSERVEQNVNKSSFSFGMVNPDVLANGQQWNEGPQRDASASISGSPLSLSDIRSFEAYKPINSRSQDHHQPEFPPCTSGRQTHGALTDEFPHLDIINDLLDDEQVMGRTATASSRFHSYSNGLHHLNRQFSFPGDVGVSGNIGLSNDMGTSTSCRFERTRSYHDDGFHQSSYGSSGGPYDTMRDMIPPANIRPYSNGHMDGLMPSQWPMAVSDRSYISTRNIEGDIYPYQHIPDYLNRASGVNSYTVFRPSNGH